MASENSNSGNKTTRGKTQRTPRTTKATTTTRRPRQSAVRPPADAPVVAESVRIADVAQVAESPTKLAAASTSPVVVERKAAGRTRKPPVRRKAAVADAVVEAAPEPIRESIAAPLPVERNEVDIEERPALKIARPAEPQAAAAPAQAPKERRGQRGGRRNRGGRNRSGGTTDQPPAGNNRPQQAQRPHSHPSHRDQHPPKADPGTSEVEQERDRPSVLEEEHSILWDDIEQSAPPRQRERSRGPAGRGDRGGDRGRGIIEVDYEDDERDIDENGEVSSAPGVAKQMLINVSAGDECRVAVMSDGRLEELFIERASAQSHVGNIYKGRVTNVEPSIQAVFIDFGLKKNGFLHISDVQPQYFPEYSGGPEEVGRKIPRHERPPIQRCFRRGQEVIVQVTKEGVGTKGPTLTTYLSIPGRFVVMMPGMERAGVSRKIEDEQARRRMKEVLVGLELPTGMGFILRTAGLDRTQRELQRDLNYLLRLWRTVVDRVKRLPAPAELYKESDLVTRAIRDIYTPDFEKVILDDAETARRAQEFLQIAMPRARTAVELYSAREPLFHRYGIEDEIERINSRHVPLRSGGSLVIESTEALVAIDVNSGKFRSIADAEETAFRINMEAADEIARQLRLRDLGGLIICDFIDMRLDRHKRSVERELRDALKKHKERARILRMSAFGIIEMTRQRQGPSMKRNIYYDCPHCKGTGLVKMPESVMLDVMRMIQLATHHESVSKVTIVCAIDVAYQILNSKRLLLGQVEAETGKVVIIRGDANFTSDQVECHTEDVAGRPIVIAATSTDSAMAKPPRERAPAMP